MANMFSNICTMFLKNNTQVKSSFGYCTFNGTCIISYLLSSLAREAAIWELEKQQLHEKHQLAKSQLKDMFFLKRHQMLTRHQKVSAIIELSRDPKMVK